MIKTKTRRMPWLASTVLPACLILGGWGYIISENRNLANSAIRNYQSRQLNELRGLADVSEGFFTRELIHQPQSNFNKAPKSKKMPKDLSENPSKVSQKKLAQVEQLLLTELIGPLQFHHNRQIWLQSIESSNRVSVALHYIDGQMNYRQHLPDAELLQAMQESQESSLVHTLVVPPEVRTKLRQLEAKGSILMLDVDRMVSVWTTVRIFPGTQSAQTRLLGSSKPSSIILEEAGVYAQAKSSTARMTLFTLGILILWGVLWKSQISQRQYKTEVERLSRTDNLTGLANRRQLYQSGELALHQLQPANPLALIALDLDRFKPINDTLGSEAGDELLVKVAHRLQSCVRQGDLLARLDGDEFAILLQNSSEQHAKICAERLLKALHQPFWIQNTVVYMNGSLGIATAASQNMQFGQLLLQADIAMDRSKNSRRGGYTMFDAAMHAEKIARLELERDLRSAIEYNELQVFYQPIVDLLTNQTIGYEALIRWQHRHRGQLQPGEFLPVAAEIGLSLSIERWVLKQACEQMVIWHGTQPQAVIPPSISVNLSAQHFAQSDLVQYVEYVLKETGWPAHRLTLEITEEAMIQHPDEVAAVLLKLQRLGVRISLDDFGTGYSSLSYLQRFPVDVLKIDKSFIKTVNDRVQDGEIVRTIIALANSLGVGTIAEGIETLEQLNHLKSLRCQYGQGFLFSHPVKTLPPDRLLHC